MRDISYFQEYERRRELNRNLRSLNYSTGTATVVTTGSGVIGGTISSSPGMYITTANTGVSYTSVAYPRYRIEKTYTFIGEIRVLQDVILQVQENGASEWVDVSQTFNSYS
jgi:hypothetical protein